MHKENSLERFVEAQATAYPAALAEIKRGRKQGHWMWFIFPQLQGLGFSSTSQYYGIRGAAEAAAYLQHPLLGKRLAEISEALLTLGSSNASQIFGGPDDVKLRSSLTLFAAVPDAPPVFQAGLDKFFQGRPDPQTLRLLAQLA